MSEHEWIEEFPGAITVCDRDGVILAMNARSAQVFAEDGGRALIGTRLQDCHPEPSRSKVVALLANGRANVYTIEKRGVKKLIHQSPWFRDGVYAGFVEISLEIPFELPHHVRAG